MIAAGSALQRPELLRKGLDVDLLDELKTHTAAPPPLGTAGPQPWLRRRSSDRLGAVYTLTTVTTPLLVLQGDQDTTVLPELTDALVKGLRERSTKVTYRRYDAIIFSYLTFATRLYTNMSVGRDEEQFLAALVRTQRDHHADVVAEDDQRDNGAAARDARPRRGPLGMRRAPG